MSCPEVSGIVSNILYLLDDENALIYPSGKVEFGVFRSVQPLNGLMGTDFSGVSGCIEPQISGTVYQPVLEAMVALELTRKSLYTASRTYSLTSFKEGDSTVTVADSAKTLNALYESLSKQFENLVKQTKFSVVSQAPCSVEGTDGE